MKVKNFIRTNGLVFVLFFSFLFGGKWGGISSFAQNNMGIGTLTP